MTDRGLSLSVALPLTVLALFAPTSCAGEEFALKDKVALGVSGRMPARLSPDGKQVIYVKRLEDGKTYAYFVIGADGKNDRKVFASTVGWDDPFTFCFGKGLFSPDGKRFAALTTSDGKSLREEGAPAMKLCSLDGKTKPKDLPSKAGRFIGAVFAADGSVIFADGFPASPKNEKEPWSCVLRRLSPEREASDIVKLDGSLLVSLTTNPKRNRVAGVLVTKPANGGRGMPDMKIWVCDLAGGKVESSGNLRLDDYFYDGGPMLFWSLDGRYVYTNGNVGGGGKNPFSLLRFEPFRKTTPATQEETKRYRKLVAEMGAEDFGTREKASKELRAAGRKALPVLREAAKSKDVEIRGRAETLVAALSGKVEAIAKGQSLVAMGEFAPGKLSVADLKARKCYVLDAATGKKTECAEPLFLVDRSGSTGLFVQLQSKRLHIAGIEAKP